MNKANVQKAINVMQRVVDQNRAFDMAVWQDDAICGVRHTEKDLHECGMAACFGGWVAVSPEFHKDGGLADDYGLPYLTGARGGVPSIAKWLGISIDDASDLAGLLPYLYWGDALESERHTVTAQEVLDVLVRLRDTGSIWPQENDQ